MRGGAGREQVRGEGGVPSSGQLEHVASCGGLNSAPTHVSTFRFSALSVEIRSGMRTEQGTHICSRGRKHRGTSMDRRKGSASAIRNGGRPGSV